MLGANVSPQIGVKSNQTSSHEKRCAHHKNVVNILLNQSGEKSLSVLNFFLFFLAICQWSYLVCQVSFCHWSL